MIRVIEALHPLQLIVMTTEDPNPWLHEPVLITMRPPDGAGPDWQEEIRVMGLIPLLGVQAHVHALMPEGVRPTYWLFTLAQPWSRGEPRSGPELIRSQNLIQALRDVPFSMTREVVDVNPGTPRITRSQHLTRQSGESHFEIRNITEDVLENAGDSLDRRAREIMMQAYASGPTHQTLPAMAQDNAQRWIEEVRGVGFHDMTGSQIVEALTRTANMTGHQMAQLADAFAGAIRHVHPSQQQIRDFGECSEGRQGEEKPEHWLEL